MKLIKYVEFSVNWIIQCAWCGRYLFSTKFKYFSSFEEGNFVSNSGFIWMKNNNKQLNITRITIINPFSAGTVFRRQNLTSTDVKLWRLKTFPALIELTIYSGCGPITQMKQKVLSKTFMMISNWKKPFGLHGLYEDMSALYELKLSWLVRLCDSSSCLHVVPTSSPWIWKVYLPLSYPRGRHVLPTHCHWDRR